eukprot:scaffold127775_cov41-Prasinocladus_malaysianus.AAC.1
MPRMKGVAACRRRTLGGGMAPVHAIDIVDRPLGGNTYLGAADALICTELELYEETFIIASWPPLQSVSLATSLENLLKVLWMRGLGERRDGGLAPPHSIEKPIC